MATASDDGKTDEEETECISRCGYPILSKDPHLLRVVCVGIAHAREVLTMTKCKRCHRMSSDTLERHLAAFKRMLIASDEAGSDSEEETTVEPEGKEADESLTSEPAPFDPHPRQEDQSSVDPPESVVAWRGWRKWLWKNPSTFPGISRRAPWAIGDSVPSMEMLCSLVKRAYPWWREMHTVHYGVQSNAQELAGELKSHRSEKLVK